MRRTTGAILVAVALALGMVLGSQLLASSQALGQPSQALGQRDECPAVPKAYGRLVLQDVVAGDGFIFEAADGTIRVVSNRDCSVKATITRN